jgi:hypothetical protein
MLASACTWRQAIAWRSRIGHKRTFANGSFRVGWQRGNDMQRIKQRRSRIFPVILLVLSALLVVSVSTCALTEPPRLSRRLVGLSHADMADSGTCE